MPTNTSTALSAVTADGQKQADHDSHTDHSRPTAEVAR
jgi:hypothetical protein